MDKSMVGGIIIGAVVATAGGAIAMLHDRIGAGTDEAAAVSESQVSEPDVSEPRFAEVLSVDKLTETIQTPRQVCEDVAVTRQKPVQDEHKILGTVTGAVIGGVLGNQVGGGTGKKLATIAGAAGGGYAGNRIQDNMQKNDTYTTTETKCRTVMDSSQRVVGYDVSYRLGDSEGKVRMDHQPGERIPVENGQLVLTDTGATTQ